jgi:preprotein translocase subunit SecB
VDEVFVRTNLGYTRKDVQEGQLSFNFDIKQQTEKPLFMICMQVGTLPKEGSTQEDPGYPYTFSVKISGYFSFAPEADKETMNRMIGPNGLSMLYGVARGLVAQITANGRHGKFVMPSMNFIEIIKAKAAEIIKAQEATPKAIPE